MDEGQRQLVRLYTAKRGRCPDFTLLGRREEGGMEGGRQLSIKADVLIPLTFIWSICLIFVFNLQDSVDEKCIAEVIGKGSD
jgi:hypothetical protein